MSFFNKKEEVLDIELTQLGKYLLAKGKFKPEYYAFSDDEVLYNLKYTDDGRLLPENDKEASKRIQRDTQRTKAFYEHDGAETRVHSQNDQSFFKIRGHSQQARKSHRIEEHPVGNMYGNDTVDDMTMGSDDRNLIRNFVGNSSVGEERVPSWDVELLLDGAIENINLSSSSPNVGIQRPVLHVEEYSEVRPKDLPALHPDLTMTAEDFSLRYSGLEREVTFIDGIKASFENDTLIFSISEENTDYMKENFEFELFLHEGYEDIRGTTAKHENLKRLYFSDNSTHFRQEEQISTYFEILSDHALAEVYGFDMRGFNRNKIKERFKKIIQSHDFHERTGDALLDGRARSVFNIGDVDDFCEEDGDGTYSEYGDGE
mgnify:CR=1 FL=1